MSKLNDLQIEILTLKKKIYIKQYQITKVRTFS